MDCLDISHRCGATRSAQTHFIHSKREHSLHTEKTGTRDFSRLQLSDLGTIVLLLALGRYRCQNVDSSEDWNVEMKCFTCIIGRVMSSEHCDRQKNINKACKNDDSRKHRLIKYLNKKNTDDRDFVKLLFNTQICCQGNEVKYTVTDALSSWPHYARLSGTVPVTTTLFWSEFPHRALI